MYNKKTHIYTTWQFAYVDDVYFLPLYDAVVMDTRESARKEWQKYKEICPVGPIIRVDFYVLPAKKKKKLEKEVGS